MAPRPSETAPGVDLVPVAPDDNNDLPDPSRSVRCRPDGTAGTLRVTTSKGIVRNTYIAAGESVPLQVTRVHSTGTTATLLEVLI